MNFFPANVSPFKDANGLFIKEGDVLKEHCEVIFYERPDGNRVAYDRTERPVVMPDRGNREKQSAWIERIVERDGACLIAKYTGVNSGNIQYKPSAFLYLNDVFDGSRFEIIKTQQRVGGGHEGKVYCYNCLYFCVKDVECHHPKNITANWLSMYGQIIECPHVINKNNNCQWWEGRR